MKILTNKIRGLDGAVLYCIMKFCVEVGKTPTQTKKMLDSSSSRRSVSMSLVYTCMNDIGGAQTSDNERVGRP